MNRELIFYINPNNPNRRTVLQALAEKGIKHIGLDGTAWHPENDIDDINAFLADINDFNVKIYAMHAACPIMSAGTDFLPDSLWTEQCNELKRFALFGGKTAIYHTCHMDGISLDDSDLYINECGYKAFLKNYSEALKRLAGVAAELNIEIMLENIWQSTYASSVSEIMKIINCTDASNLGICLDSGHAHLAGKNIAQEIRNAGAWLKDTHFHDNVGPVNGTFPDQHLPPGLGTINWQDVCQALHEIQYSRPICFEGVLGPGDSIENGRFNGKLSYENLIDLTNENWKAFEYLTYSEKD